MPYSFLLVAQLLLALSTPKPPKTYPVGQIKTRLGEVLFWLYDETPRHKASFIRLANAAYWDTLTFNRVIPNFVAQGGCPDTPAGFADSPYLLKPEFVQSIRHIYGAVAPAATIIRVNCRRAVGFVVQNKKGLARLDDNYTVFGQVFSGMDVIDAICNAPRDSTDTPLTPIKLDVNVLHLTAAELKKRGYTGTLN